MNLFVIGEQVLAWAEKFTRADATTVLVHDSLTLLRGSTPQMTDELQRRRDDVRLGGWLDVGQVAVYGPQPP